MSKQRGDLTWVGVIKAEDFTDGETTIWEFEEISNITDFSTDIDNADIDADDYTSQGVVDYINGKSDITGDIPVNFNDEDAGQQMLAESAINKEDIIIAWIEHGEEQYELTEGDDYNYALAYVNGEATSRPNDDVKTIDFSIRFRELFKDGTVEEEPAQEGLDES